MKTPSPPDRLGRELGLTGAALLGLGSIIGTGVFVGIGIAAGVAGPAVLIAIVLAAGLATCNALSSAQLAAAYPVSGGTYEYGYRLLRPELGFLAGWMFLCAKSASAAAAALGTAGYAFHLADFDPAGMLKWAGLAVAVLVTGLVLSGLRRSNAVNAVIVSLTLFALAAFVTAGLDHLATGGGERFFTPFFIEAERGPIAALLHATALIFVAYTGYGRIATMGEEVRDPRRNIPRAIIVTLIVSAVLYVLVAITAVGAAGPEALSRTTDDEATPLETAAQVFDVPGLPRLIAFGAITAMLGVLLNLVLGLSRVALAMGRRGDLPARVGKISAGGAPRAAILLVGAVIAGLALTGDIATVWSFSALTVLIYYAITNLAALRLPRTQRLYPPIIAWTGLAGCLSLTIFIPAEVWLAGAGLGAGGFLLRALLLKSGGKKLEKEMRKDTPPK